jgi:hypothetical protein
VEWLRGFIWDVSAGTERYINEGGSWNAPIQSVNLWHVHGLAERLSLCPHLFRVTQFSIYDDLFDDDDLATLVGSSYLAAVKHVEMFGYSHLEGTSVRGDGLFQLAQAAFFPNLYSLRIRSDAGLSAHGLGRLNTTKAELDLASLRLEHCGIDDHGAAALGNTHGLSALHTLSLNSNAIGDAGLVALATSSSLPEGIQIDLRGNPVSGSGLSTLAANRCVPGLRLDLSSCPIQTISIDAVAALVQKDAGFHLSLEGCPLPDRVRKAISLLFPERVTI